MSPSRTRFGLCLLMTAVLAGCFGEEEGSAPLVDPFRNPIPKDTTDKVKYPRWASVTYDSMNSLATLAWVPPSSGTVQQYGIYRKRPGDQDFTRITTLSPWITSYPVLVEFPEGPKPILPALPEVDSIFPIWFDTAKALERGPLIKRAADWDSPIAVQFQVEAITHPDSAGRRTAACTLTVRSSQWYRTQLGFRTRGLRQGVLSIGDTAAFLLEYSHPSGKVESITWTLHGDTTVLKRSLPGKASGTDSLPWLATRTGRFLLDILIIGSKGDTADSRIPFSVIKDSPRAYAGRDSSYAVGDTVPLKGHAHDGFSRRFEYAWDIGGAGTFRKTSGPETSFVAPDLEGQAYSSILKVVDDDGFEALDTVSFRFYRPWPGNWKPLAPRDYLNPPLASTQATFLFRDRFWLVGGVPSRGDGLVRSTTDGVHLEEPQLRLPPSRLAHSASAVFKDRMWMIGGQSFDATTKSFGEATVEVWSSADGLEWTRSRDFPSRRAGAACLVYKDRIWVIGGGFTDNTRTLAYNDVWSSADGESWERATDSSAFKPRNWPAALVYSDRMWIFGGFTLEASTNDYRTEFGDAWSSADGRTWERASGPQAYPGRYGHAAVAFEGRIWLLGGYPSRDGERVWSSEDGVTWAKTAGSAPFPGLSFHDAFVRGGKIWVAGSSASDSYSGPFWRSW